MKRCFNYIDRVYLVVYSGGIRAVSMLNDVGLQRALATEWTGSALAG